MTKPVCAIMGAGPGIGLAVACRFGQAGYRLALVARRAGALDNHVPNSLESRDYLL